MPTAPSPLVEFMNVTTPLAYLRSGAPADTFRALRAKVSAEAGFDFLAPSSGSTRLADSRRNARKRMRGRTTHG